MNSFPKKNNTKITPKQTVYHIINTTLRKEKENATLKQENTTLKEENRILKETIQTLKYEIYLLKQ